MRKAKSFIYGLGMMVSHTTGFAIFGIILAMLIKLPNNMFGGILIWPLMLSLYYCAANDETRELINKLMTGNSAEDKKQQ
ncbi:MAG: hypothetical protein II995_07740 [Oscillospiraceae bacterium]|nr:hypothetical protein [Oscillospiraceae bacterium]